MVNSKAGTNIPCPRVHTTNRIALLTPHLRLPPIIAGGSNLRRNSPPPIPLSRHGFIRTRHCEPLGSTTHSSIAYVVSIATALRWEWKNKYYSESFLLFSCLVASMKRSMPSHKKGALDDMSSCKYSKQSKNKNNIGHVSSRVSWDDKSWKSLFLYKKLPYSCSRQSDIDV